MVAACDVLSVAATYGGGSSVAIAGPTVGFYVGSSSLGGFPTPYHKLCVVAFDAHIGAAIPVTGAHLLPRLTSGAPGRATPVGGGSVPYALAVWARAPVVFSTVVIDDMCRRGDGGGIGFGTLKRAIHSNGQEGSDVTSGGARGVVSWGAGQGKTRDPRAETRDLRAASVAFS